MLNIAVSDPTQVNIGIIHIEIPTTAAAIVSQDDAVSFDQISPTVRLSINAKGSHGKSFRTSLTANAQ